MTTYLLAFAVALGSALLVTPVVRRVAIRFGVMDAPSERKIHRDPVPYLGGLAIVFAFVLSMFVGAVAKNVLQSFTQIIAILGGGLLLSLMGLWDDLKVVPGWVKVPLELGLGAGLYFAGVRAELFQFMPIDLLITMAWVVGITNAVNYMDNMDGLTGGVVAIAATYFAVLAALSDQILVASLSSALAGCSIGFLWHNRPPARIFMGDAGSLFLGFLLAGAGLELRFENIARVTFFVPVAILAVPILDALMVSVSRVLRGLSPIRPGQDHISHRLVNVGIPPKGALGLIYFTAAACGWIGVVIAFSGELTAYMLMGWLLLVGAFVGFLLIRVKV